MNPASDELPRAAAAALAKLRSLYGQARLRAYLSSPDALRRWHEIEPPLVALERDVEQAPGAALPTLREALARIHEFLAAV